MTQLKRRKPLLALFAVIVLYLVGEAVNHFVFQGTAAVYTHAIRFLRWSAAQQLGVGVLTLLAFVGLLVLLGFLETSPVGKAVIERVKGRLGHRISVLELKNEVLHRNLDERLQELERYKSELAASRSAFYEAHFGISVPTYSFNDSDKDAIRQRFEEGLWPLIERAQAGLESTAVVVNNSFIGTDDKLMDLGRPLARYSWKAELVPAKRAYKLIHECLTPGMFTDPRPALYLYYIKYNDVRAWFLQANTLLEGGLQAFPEYREWRRVDQEFLNLFSQIMKNTLFTDVAQSVRQTEGKMHYPVALPDWPPGPESST